MLDKSPKFIYVKSELLTLCINEVTSQNRKKIQNLKTGSIYMYIKQNGK